MIASVLPEAYRLDVLLTPDTHPRTGKPRAGFETVAQCQTEDRSRAVALRATAQAIIARSNDAAAATAELTSHNFHPQAAVNLADRLQAGAESGRPQPTLAAIPSKTNARC